MCLKQKVVIYGNGRWKCIQETMLLFILLEMRNMSINLIVVELGQMIINVCILCVSNSAPPESPEVKEPV